MWLNDRQKYKQVRIATRRYAINLKIIKLLRSKSTYLVVGNAYQAMLLVAIAAISGARKIILGLHSRPSYKRFIHIKPLLILMNRAGLVKGIHAVNIVDALTLRKILSNIPVWWIPNSVDCRRFKPGAKRDDVFQALFIGTLSNDKGLIRSQRQHESLRGIIVT